jgi:hypothetical protein
MPQRDPAKENYWRRLLRDWRHSGLTGRGFCFERRVSEASFYAWRREIARRDRHKAASLKRKPASATPLVPGQSSVTGTPAFIKLAINGDATTPPPIEVVVAEGRVVRVRPGFDADLLRQLLRLLEEPSC